MEQPQRQSFEPIYREHRRMVAQMCLGFAQGELGLAEDLTQEVFINVWKGLPYFKGQASLRTWIYRITVNTCLRQVRKQPGDTVPLEEASEELPALPPTEVVSHQPLYQAIGRLPETDRLIIMMVLEDQPYEEIAAVMGLSPGALRVRIHRVKQKLKKWLDYA